MAPGMVQKQHRTQFLSLEVSKSNETRNTLKGNRTQRDEIMWPRLPPARAENGHHLSHACDPLFDTVLIETMQAGFVPASAGSAVKHVRESPSQVGSKRL